MDTGTSDCATLERATLVRRPVTFEAGEPAQMVFGAGDEAAQVPVDDALPVLMHAQRDSGAHPITATWSGAAVLALRLIARGRLRDPDPSEVAQLRSVAAALPYDDEHAYHVVRGFMTALADTMPHSPAAPTRSEPAPPTARRRSRTPAGVHISLRIDFGGTTPAPESEPRGTDPAHFPTPGAVAVVCVHDSADPIRVIEAAELWSSEHHGFGARARIDVISAINRIAHVWSALQRLQGHVTTGRIALEDDEVSSLRSGSVAGRLLAAGIEVRWPRELRGELTYQAVVSQTRATASGLGSVLGGDAAFGFDWRLALGDELLSDAELDTLAGSARGIVHLRDQWFVVDPETVQRARDRHPVPLDPAAAVRAALTGTVSLEGETIDVTATGALDELRRKLSDPDGSTTVGPPAALSATLRDYQLRGLQWLARMSGLGLGGCLADDMGLGKTVMLIALHLHRAAEPGGAGPTLVVCPASVLGNWEREIRRFAPGVPVHRFHGAERQLPATDGGFVLTTYATMRSDAVRLATRTGGWGLVVADEAQHVKNPYASTAQALRTIPAQARIALTGTPVENNLSELWAILDWTTPGLLGDLDTFRRRWVRPIESRGEDGPAQELARLVRPFLLRRRKSDPGIAPELSPKTETDRRVRLTREQVGLYEAAVRETLAQIAESEGMRRRGLIVKLLTACKQICNHPSHYLGDGVQRLTGRSGKLTAFDDLMDTLLAAGGSVLVFTQYVAMGRLLERHLRDRGVDPLFLHGSTPVGRRDEMVEQFQSGQRPVFLLSLKAAGTGLNLTQADHVIHYDRWWNPAVEDQATDRAHRIGQTKPVQVHRLVADGTVEDRVAELLASKRALADAVVDGAESALTELTDADLADLVRLRTP